VITQWRRWCLNREYVVGYRVRASYASVKTPILAASFAV
jgi:predicted alpha/beta hydrolase